MQYLVLIHGNADSVPGKEEWDHFIQEAHNSGMFQGGSALGKRYAMGKESAFDSTQIIVGFMRFDSDDLMPLQDLLESHPVIRHGGTLELREMPLS